MKRTLLLLLAVLMIVAAVPGIALAARPAAVVRVPANADPGAPGGGGISTEVTVTAGQPLDIRAHGQAITGPLRDFPGARSGPDGQVANAPCGPPFPAEPSAVAGAPYGALLIFVGSEVIVGGSFSGPAPAGGEIRLAVNDNIGLYGDNRGNFSVQIRTGP